MSWLQSMGSQGSTVSNGGIGQSGIQGGSSIPVSDSLSPQTNAALAQGGTAGNVTANLFANLVQPYADAGKGIYADAKKMAQNPGQAFSKVSDFGLDQMKQRLQQRMAAPGASAPTPNQKGHSLSIGNILSAYTGGLYQSNSGASTPKAPVQSQGAVNPNLSAQTASGTDRFNALMQAFYGR